MTTTDTTASGIRDRGLSEVSVSFFDGRLEAEVDDLKAAVVAADTDDFNHSRGPGASTVAPLQAELDQKMAALAESEIRFQIRALPRKVFEALHSRWPAKEDDLDADGKPLPYHGDGLIPELFARSVTSPALTQEDAQYLYDNWSDVDVGRLLTLAYGINRTYRKVPFIVPATGGTESTEPSSTTPAIEGSP